MIETSPLNHNWLDFVILSGLTLQQFQKELLLRGHDCIVLSQPESSLDLALDEIELSYLF